MMPYTYSKSSITELAALKRDYLNDISAPLDGMWEIFANMADHYAISSGGKTCGYFAVNDERKLMQFYLPDASEKRGTLKAIIAELHISGAFVSTAEPAYLSLCLDEHSAIAVNALMYYAHDTGTIPEPIFPDGCDFRLVAKSELEIAVQFGMSAFEADEAWLKGYYQDHIAQEQLYGLWHGGDLIAAGELRRSASQKAYADVGMVVSKHHRGSGIATNTLLKLRRLAREQGLIAICSTERDNIPAQKAITNAGFVSYHRVLDITFNA